jgi:hypothetical protein
LEATKFTNAIMNANINNANSDYSTREHRKMASRNNLLFASPSLSSSTTSATTSTYLPPGSASLETPAASLLCLFRDLATCVSWSSSVPSNFTPTCSVYNENECNPALEPGIYFNLTSKYDRISSLRNYTLYGSVSDTCSMVAFALNSLERQCLSISFGLQALFLMALPYPITTFSSTTVSSTTSRITSNSYNIPVTTSSNFQNNVIVSTPQIPTSVLLCVFSTLEPCSNLSTHYSLEQSSSACALVALDTCFLSIAPRIYLKISYSGGGAYSILASLNSSCPANTGISTSLLEYQCLPFTV